MKKLFLFIISILLLTGCSDYHELQDLGVVSSLYIDYDGEYKVTVEVSGIEESSFYKGRGTTLENAIQNTMESSKQYIYLSHIDVLILTEKVDIENTMLYLFRNPEINNSFYVIISEDESVLKLKEIGKTLKNILKRSEFDDSFEIIKNITDNKRDYVIPCFKDGYIDKLAVIKNNSISFYLDNKQIQIYRILKGLKNSYITGTCKDNTYEVNTNEVSVKYNLKDKLNVKVSVSLSISIFNCDYDLTKLEEVQKFQNLTKEKIKEEIEDFFLVLKNNKVDLFNLNNFVINKNKVLNDRFYKYDFDIDVSSNVNKKGLILK